MLSPEKILECMREDVEHEKQDTYQVDVYDVETLLNLAEALYKENKELKARLNDASWDATNALQAGAFDNREEY